MGPKLNESANEFKTFWGKINAFMTPSTVRAIVLAFGTLGFKFTEGKFQAWMVTISAIIYIAFEFFRTDSAQSAVNTIEEALKKKGILSIMIIIFLFPIGMVHADPSICVEPATGAATYELKMDGTYIDELTPQSWTDGDGVTWHCLYDLGAAGLAPGEHNFEARSIHASGMPGDWSLPFVISKPGTVDQWLIRR